MLKKERRQRGIEDNDEEGAEEGSQDEGEDTEWDTVETARLYSEFTLLDIAKEVSNQ